MNSITYRILAWLIVGVSVLGGVAPAADLPTSIPRSAIENLPPPPEATGPEVADPAAGPTPALAPVPEGMVVDGAPRMPMTDSCNTYFGRGSACPPKWYVDTGVRLLSRLRSPSVPLGEWAIPAGNNTLYTYPALDATNANFDAPAGYTVTLGYHLAHDAQNNDDFLEFTYWGLNHWSDSYQVSGGNLSYTVDSEDYLVGNLISHFASEVSGFNRANSMSIRYDSEVHNFEWNLRLVPRQKQDRLVLHPDGRWEREAPTGWMCNYLIGLRYISYDESFSFGARGAVFQNGTAVGSSSGNYQSFTQNDMLGIQVGTEISWQEARWNWGVRVKAGPYTNWCAQQSYAHSEGAGIDPLASIDLNYTSVGDDDQMAFVGELGLFASYKLRKNLNLHASYDFFWLSGVAMAPKQISYEADPANHIHNSTTTLLQGVSLRAEFLW